MTTPTAISKNNNIYKKESDNSNKDDLNIYDYLLKDDTSKTDEIHIKYKDASLKVELKNEKKEYSDDHYYDDDVAFLNKHPLHPHDRLR